MVTTPTSLLEWMVLWVVDPTSNQNICQGPCIEGINTFIAFLRKFLKFWSFVIIVKFVPNYCHNFFVQGVYIAKMGGNWSVGTAGPAKHEIVYLLRLARSLHTV